MKQKNRLSYALPILAMFLLALPAAALSPFTEFVDLFARDYKLPRLLVTADGKKVLDRDTWVDERRPEILDLYRKHVYGGSPGPPENMSFRVFEAGNALSGKAKRKQVRITIQGREPLSMDLLVYVPVQEKPAPAFLILNFGGNHTVRADPAVRITSSWVRNKGLEITGHRATESSRGSACSRFPVEAIISRGYALATMYYGDIDPDYDDGFNNGVHAVAGPSPSERAPDSWGAIAAWAWGLSRTLDYLEKDPDVDAGRVAVAGHSRLGKTALWAGACDRRFALVISNESGCGGAALFRRKAGETITAINTGFPHWFCKNFHRYNGKEQDLPVDQHMLIALIAPRPVYVASASADWWSDPKGEFLATVHASPAWELFGKQGLQKQKMPEMGTSAGSHIGYHVRAGGHDLTPLDWRMFMDFADERM